MKFEQDERVMRTLGIAFAAGLLMISLAGSGYAQKKASKKPVAKKPTTQTIVPPLDVRAAREKVDVQFSNVNDFVNKLAAVAQGLEVADADAKAGNLSPKTTAKIGAKKTEIVEAIRNIRYALTGLESEFRTKTSLQKYLPSISGITDLSAASEDSAIAGKFVASKDPLRDIAKKLADTLAVLPR
jgi:hypothetical protein